MKKTLILLAAALGLISTCPAIPIQATPKIQFDQTVYDFGKTSQVSTVSGIFKFKNIGDAVLKMDPPKPSCGCTAADHSKRPREVKIKRRPVGGRAPGWAALGAVPFP